MAMSAQDISSGMFGTFRHRRTASPECAASFSSDSPWGLPPPTITINSSPSISTRRMARKIVDVTSSGSLPPIVINIFLAIGAISRFQSRHGLNSRRRSTYSSPRQRRVYFSREAYMLSFAEMFWLRTTSAQ